MKVILAVLLFSCLCGFASATYGVDVSSLVSTNSWSCMRNNSIKFAIMRCWRSLGNVDPNCAASVKNAHAAGIPYVDVYMFPCPKCGNPKGQVNSLVNHMNSNGIKHGMLWLDIEGTQYWMSNQTANRVFMQGLISEAVAKGQKLGIYTSKSQWTPIMGNWNGGAKYPLWYAHYDNNPSFSDFSPFGGWTKPAIKQYKGTTSLCGASVDRNWYP